LKIDHCLATLAELIVLLHLQFVRKNPMAHNFKRSDFLKASSLAILGAAATACVPATQLPVKMPPTQIAAIIEKAATLTNGSASAGQKVVTVDNTTGLIAGATIAYQLSSGRLEYNVIASVDGPAQITLTANIGEQGIADNSYLSLISMGEYLAAQAVNHATTINPTVVDAMTWAAGEFFNVMAFGAVGDGIANDTAAIQATVDAAAKVHGTVYIPPGRYLITSINISDQTNLTITGAGTNSVLVTASNLGVIVCQKCSRLLIADLAIEGDADVKKEHQRGVDWHSVIDSMIRNVSVANVGYDAILLFESCIGNTIMGCFVDSAYDDGINIGGKADLPTTDTTVVGNIIKNANHDGIHISAGSLRTSAQGNVISGCEVGVGLFKTAQVTVVGNVIENCEKWGVGVHAGPCADFTLTNNVMRGGTRGIWITSNCHNYAINGNVIKDPGQYGIAISEKRIDAEFASVIGNQISGGCEKAAILISGCTDMIVASNQISGVTALGISLAESTSYCVRITISHNHIACATIGINQLDSANSKYFAIEGNFIQSGSTTGIYFGGGSYFRIAGNWILAASDYGIRATASASRPGYGMIVDNMIIEGCKENGIDLTNIDDVTIDRNLISGITSATAININKSMRVAIGQQQSGTIKGGQQGLTVALGKAATTPGSVVKKIEIFDCAGTSLGFIPVYDTIK
jgi:hypothetical protein